MKNFPKSVTCIAVLTLMAGTANAELVEYSFKDTSSQSKAVTPATGAGVSYINPVGAIRFALSAGIDRKVRVTLLNAQNSPLGSKTSSLLGANDRITINGKSYYGAFLDIPAPSEGEYTVTAEILNSANAVVQKDTYKIVVDITPPKLENISWVMGYGGGTAADGIPIFSAISPEATPNSIQIGSIQDNFLINKISYQVVEINSNEIKDSGVFKYNGESSLKMMKDFTGPLLDKIKNGKFKIKFLSEDIAGNKGEIEQVFYNNTFCGAVPEFVGLYDAGKIKEKINGKNIIEELPVTALYKIEKNNYRGIDPIWGMTMSNSSSKLEYSDENYAYVSVTGPLDKSGNFPYPLYRWTNSSRYSCATPSVPDVVLDEKSSAPVLGKAELYINDYGWVSAGFAAKNSQGVPLNTTIGYYKMSVGERNYEQVVTFSSGDVCKIPAGDTSCQVVPKKTTQVNKIDTYGRVTFNSTVRSSINSIIAASNSGRDFTWDRVFPKISEISNIDHIQRKIYFDVIEDGTGSYGFGIKSARIVAKNKATGAEFSLKATINSINGNIHATVVDYSSLSQGEYILTGIVEDNYENVSTKEDFHNLLIDKTAPEINFVSGGSKISSLDEISFSVADNIDVAPKLDSIELTGGPLNEKINLAARKNSSGTYSIEYPVMFPSLSEGEKYTLNVSASDSSGNLSKKSLVFTYSPPTVSLSNDKDGNLLIPSVLHEFKRKTGNILETNPLKLKDGSIVNGTYSISATLRSDAKVPLVINGVTVNPGETKVVAGAYNFASTAGKISLPVRPATDGMEGTSSLLITTTAPNSPMLVASVGVWKPALSVLASSLKVVQAIEPVSVKISSAAGSRCRITLNESEAIGADVVDDPVCLLQWDKLPKGVEPSQASFAAKATSVELIGQVATAGEHELGYTLYMFDLNGEKIQVAKGTEKLVAKEALGSVALAPSTDLSTVNRLIQDLNFKLAPSGSSWSCLLTLTEARAKADAQSRMPDAVSQQCWFEWLEMPDGLAQDTLYDTPQVRGTLAEKKAHGLKWRVSMFTRSGEKIVLNEQTYSMNAVDPQAPEVTMTSKFQLEGRDVVVVPMSESSFGVASISAASSLLDITVSRDADVQTSTVKPGNGAASSRAQRVLQAAPATAWTASQHKVRASYNLIPEVFTEKALTVYLAPPLNIKPLISVESSQGIDNTPYPVKVSIVDRTKPEEPYDEAKMGKWKVRLIREMVYNKTEPLTDFVDATGGTATFNVDLSKIDATSMRFNVEAVLESPIEGYARTESASRSSLMTIVRGGLIEGSITALRMSGQAPFKALLKLGLKDTKNARYTGDVTWEVSADGGSTWEANPVQERYKYQLSRVFELGDYKVRAKIANAHTGVAGYTEAVDVVAYDKPKAQIVGSRAYFVGATAKLQAMLKNGDNTLDLEDYIVDWSLDGGATFTVEGPELTLQENNPRHLKLALRAKPKNAPEKDFSAYHIVRASLDFLPVKPPRPYISGPLRMEKGKTYTFTARTTMPYHGMGGEVKGFFTLPNGQQVEGNTATYSPTDEDMQKEFVETKYTTWIEGFREAGAENSTSARSRTWEYIFPNFGMEIRRTAPVAPATVTAILRPIAFNGRLEEPTYEWKLPEGAVVLEEKPTLRVFTINTNGVSTLEVAIGDARGNKKVLEQSVVLGEANPYKVDLQYSTSNTFNREPLEVLLRPYVTGGHPLDRVASASYFVNDQEIPATGGNARTTLQAGDYNIRYRINSKMGTEAEGRIELSVKPNEVPVCKVTARATIASRIYNADCTDSDGRIKTHEWTVNGQVATATGSRLSINLKTGEQAPSVSLVAIDDAGGRSNPVSPQSTGEGE